jgi:hypothetical protein
VSDIDIAVADSLKVLDLKRPIREADINFGASTPPVYEVYGLTQAWRETAYQLR